MPENFSKKIDRLQAGYQTAAIIRNRIVSTEIKKRESYIFCPWQSVIQVFKNLKNRKNIAVLPPKHMNRFVNCVEGIVYLVPLSCSKKYVGRTGRYLNERLKEHHYNIHKVISGHLGPPL